MKPIDFKESNVIMGKDQPEYQPLPAFKDSGKGGHLISCWKLSVWERIKLLFTGKIWHSCMTFHKPLQPQFFTVNKTDVLVKLPEPMHDLHPYEDGFNSKGE